MCRSPLWTRSLKRLAMSTWLAVPQARFRIRPLFDDLVRGGAYSRKFRCRVRLSRESLRMIEWWRDLQSDPTVGRTVWRPPVDTPFCTDASTSIGWGGTYGASPLTGDPQQSIGLPAAGIWTQQERASIKAGDLNITGLELIAVRRCLELWQRMGLIRGRSLLLFEDNAGVVGILRNYCARAPAMRDDLLAVMNLLEAEDAELRVRWVASALNPSDYFSRMPSKGEWTLDPAEFRRLSSGFPPCTVDLFASALSAQLPRFASPFPCHGCETVDAFSRSWSGERSWINPPWSLLPRIVQRLVEEPAASAVLLVPFWPSQPWWPVLLSLADGLRRVSIPPAAVQPSGLAVDMGVVPEPLRQSGRCQNLALVYVPFRAPSRP
eukprot:SAG31_NODE_3155_length_4612_cov_2.728784_2_plen_379_part_00